ncbi:extracellular solute-binding protein [Paenibacillus sp. LMG 31461]|uniref:Extracellular solute-binding protein n=1 Tax=Paenibacillus plantarum TaxID=2654975 RepID=A0ABX1X4V1_9BACL|nr:extracellular solute-binding protein [Paenibacillus plantarum]NOU63302.1 extracellular solute-binding protein [Paenibacillus plantarum]
MRRESDFLYTTLYNTLKGQIISGFIKPGEYLLPESDLCKYYKLSRNSVRKALDLLQKEMLITKKVGLGTMVPLDLVIEPSKRKTLRIASPAPAYFVDYGLPQIIKAFQQKYPNVDVKIVHLPRDNFWESFRQSCDIGLNADIILSSDLQFTEAETMDAFMDLSPVLTDYTETIYPKILNYYRLNDEIKAAPVTFTPVFLVYNPVMFELNGIQPPNENWKLADFIDAAERLTKSEDGVIVQYGFSIFPYLTRWPVFALQNGLNTLEKAAQKDIIQKSLLLIQDLFFRKRIATVYTEMPGPKNPFVSGKSAMVLTTTLEMSTWKDKNIGFEPQIVPLPFGEVKATLLQASALMIPKDCSAVQLAEAFIKISLDDEVQASFCLNSPFLSVKEKINTSIRDKQSLYALNIEGSLMQNNYFLRELFHTISADELSAEMSLFWLGLESPQALADTFS